jgi:ectoine hydroxylase-related dioxygenase (phytanoyl-CoA dioxygenase family)
LGHLTYTLSENDEANVLNQTVAGAEQLGDPIDVELNAGEISLHSDLLLHGSEANQSSRRRCGLTLRYCPADVRAGLGWNAKGVVVSGQDASSHWANPPRPQAD